MSKETEIVIYAKIGNSAGLNKADSIINQIQCGAKFIDGNRCRTRDTIVDNISKKEYTIKIEENTDSSIKTDTEFTVPVDDKFFEGFKRIADTIIHKTRYIFESSTVRLCYTKDGDKIDEVIGNIKYEVDVFFNKDETTSEWCKIDVEIDSILEHINRNHKEVEDINFTIKISHLPFNPMEAILYVDATGEQKDFIANLWDHVWNKKA